MKIKLDKNDQLFSLMIRERDSFRCVFCGKSKDNGYTMQASHYWGRGDKVHRFNPLNVDTLCFTCHMNNEGNKQGFYRDWKLKQLGEELHKKMEQDHYQLTKKYGAFEKKLLSDILKKQYENKEHLSKEWTVNW